LFPVIAFSLNWQVSTIDSLNDVGAYSSIACDTLGRPHISYTDLTTGRLKYAYYNGSSWTTSVIGTTGALGYYTSLDLDSFDKPHISHYNPTYGRLLYTKEGTSTIVDFPNVGKFSSLKLDINGYPNISYYDEKNKALKYAFWTGIQWASQTVDYCPNKDRGRFSSLFLIENELPCISYYDATDGDLRFAFWNITTWGSRTIDTIGDVGQYSSLIGKDGTLYIAYYDATNKDLKYAKNSSGTWTLQTIDSLGDVGKYCSIGITGSNTVYISYYDETNGNLKVAWGSDTFQNEAIDTDGDVGMYTAITTHGNIVYISYYDVTNGDLKYATIGTETIPNTPTNLTASPISSSTINLSWSDNSINENWFIIERGLNVNTFSIIGTTTLATYTDTGLSSNTTYYYRVCAYNSYGTSGYSNIASATTFSLPPIAPGNLVATSTGSLTIILSWTDNSTDELWFVIERGQTITTFSIIGTTILATYTDTGLFPNTTYYYRVYAFNLTGGSSSYSNIASATTFDIPPSPPSGLIASTISSSEIKLQWSDNSNNEDGFLIERKKSPGTFTIIALLGSNTTLYNDTGLLPNTTYYYRVASYNIFGTSSYSNIASATTGYSLLYISPQGITIGSGSTKTVSVIIDNVLNMVGASIYLSFSPNILEVSTITQGSFPPSGDVLKASFDNASGTIIYSVILMAGSSTGSGTLVNIEFRGKSNGTSGIIFETSTNPGIEKTNLIDNDGANIPFNYLNGFASSTTMGSLTGKVVSSICSTTFMEFSGINVKILPLATTTTNGSSSFFFTNVPTGTWTLWADTYGAGSISTLIYIGTDTDIGTLSLIAGDADDSGQVNLSDFYIFRSQYGLSGVGLEGDFDHNATVNITDFYILRQNFGKTRGLSIAGLNDNVFLSILSPKSIKNKEEFEVFLNIANVSSLIGGDFYLSYNPEILEAKRIEKGQFLNNAPVLQEKIENGTISYSIGLLQGDVSGTGTIARIIFKARAFGESMIEFKDKTCLMDFSGKYIPYSKEGRVINVEESSSFVKIEPEDSKIFIDGTKTIGIYIEAYDLFGANIEVLYQPDKLSILNIEKGNFPDVFLFSTNTGKINLVGARLGTCSNGLVLLANITFMGIQEGTASLLFSLVDLRDKNNKKIQAQIFPGTITIKKYLTADLNKDDIINFNDLMLIVTNWKGNKPEYDIGPADGIPPNLIPKPDGIIDFEDLMVFCIMWKWYNVRAQSKEDRAQNAIVWIEKENNEFLIKYSGFSNIIGGNITLSFEGGLSISSDLPIFLPSEEGGGINLSFASLPLLPPSGIIAKINAKSIRLEDVEIRDSENKRVDIQIKATNFSNAFCYPNPSKTGWVRFENLPANTYIRIYNIAGELIFEKENFDINPTWDVKNIASGVYIYLLNNGGDKKIGKIGVIR